MIFNPDVVRVHCPLQSKLEAQYAAKRNVQLSEISDLRQQLEHRKHETENQTTTIDNLKAANEELKVSRNGTRRPLV